MERSLIDIQRELQETEDKLEKLKLEEFFKSNEKSGKILITLKNPEIQHPSYVRINNYSSYRDEKYTCSMEIDYHLSASEISFSELLNEDEDKVELDIDCKVKADDIVMKYEVYNKAEFIKSIVEKYDDKVEETGGCCSQESCLGYRLKIKPSNIWLFVEKDFVDDIDEITRYEGEITGRNFNQIKHDKIIRNVIAKYHKVYHHETTSLEKLNLSRSELQHFKFHLDDLNLKEDLYSPDVFFQKLDKSSIFIDELIFIVDKFGRIIKLIEQDEVNDDLLEIGESLYDVEISKCSDIDYNKIQRISKDMYYQTMRSHCSVVKLREITNIEEFLKLSNSKKEHFISSVRDNVKDLIHQENIDELNKLDKWGDIHCWYDNEWHFNKLEDCDLDSIERFRDIKFGDGYVEAYREITKIKVGFDVKLYRNTYGNLVGI